MEPQAQQVGRELTTQEQEMHDRIYGIAGQLLYSDQFLPKAEEIMKTSPTPVAGAATLAVTLGAKVLESAQQSGQQIPGAALMSAGWAVMQEVKDFAEQFLDIELSDEQAKAAFFNAADQMSDMANLTDVVSVDMTPEEEEAMRQDAGGQEGVEAARQRARQMARGQGEAPAETPAASRGLGARK